MSTRRNLLSAAAGLAAAGVMPAVAAPITAGADPMLALCDAAKALDRQIDEASSAVRDQEARMVAQAASAAPLKFWRDFHAGTPADQLLTKLRETVDTLVDRESQILDHIEAVTPTTPEGVRAKAEIALAKLQEEKVLQRDYWIHGLLASALQAAAGRA